MPIFHFRLTDTETGEYRNVSVSADSKSEAEATVMRQEYKKVAFQVSEEELANLLVMQKVSQGKSLDQGEKDRFVNLLEGGRGAFTGREKARLLTHRQEKPYTIQKAKEA